MRQRHVILIIFSIYSNVLISQKNQPSTTNVYIKDVYKILLDTINIKELHTCKYDSSLSLKYFDFDRFERSRQPENSLDTTTGYYTIHYKDKCIKKITYYSKGGNQANYTLYFVHKSSFIYYIAETFEIGDTGGDLVCGFFVYDKSLSKNFYFGLLPHNAFNFISEGGISFIEFNKESGCLDIYKVFILDKRLQPIYRTNWKNDIFVSQSDINYKKNDEVIEDMLLFVTHNCGVPLLSEMTLEELYNVSRFGQESCERALKVYVKPDYDKLPLWISSDSFYK